MLAVLRAGKESETIARQRIGEPLFATQALAEGGIVNRGGQVAVLFGSR